MGIKSEPCPLIIQYVAQLVCALCCQRDVWRCRTRTGLFVWSVGHVLECISQVGKMFVSV